MKRTFAVLVSLVMLLAAAAGYASVPEGQGFSGVTLVFAQDLGTDETANATTEQISPCIWRAA